MAARFAVVATLALAVGCLESSSVQCGDGRLCPAGTICSATGCHTEEQRAACAAKLDGDACTVAGTTGACVAGACTQVICGNRKIDPGELCDDGNLDSLDGCRGDCRSDERCGNGIIDPLLGEGCDCGDAVAVVPGYCLGPNTDASPTSCRTDCELPLCGNAVLDPGEACDDGNLVGGDGCSSDCRSDESCGNGIVDYALTVPEDCDCGSSTPAAGCSSANSDTGGLCRSDCHLHCGDGEVRGNELCDPGTPMVDDCLDFGFDAGHIACSAACAPDFAGCRRLGWWKQSSPLTSLLVDIGGTSRDDYFIMKYDGSIAHFTGGSWQVSPFNWSMKSMWVDSMGRVFSVGQDGKILRLEGGSWTTMTSNVTSTLLAVTGTSASNVIAVGDTGTIVRFDGSTWMPMSSPTTSSLSAVWAAASNDVFAAGDNGALLHYNGTDWTEVSSPTTSSVFALWGTAADNVYLATVIGVFHYDGEQWVKQPVGNGLFSDVWGTRADDVFAVGDRTYHFDGISWTEIAKPTTARMLGVWSAGGRTFAVGQDNTVLAFDGEAWGDTGMSSGGQLYAPLARRADDVLAAACGGVQHFDGNSWKASSPSDGYCSTDVWESPDGELFSVGLHGSIHRLRTDGWVSMAFGIDIELLGVWGTNSTNVYAIGYGGSAPLFHYTGSTWDPVSVPSTGVLLDLWGTGPSDVYAVGSDVLHYNGLTWTKEPVQFDLGSATGVWGSAPNDVFVVGYGGQIQHFNGTSWSKMASGTMTPLMAVWGTGPSDVFAVGFSGTVLHYDGISWTRYRAPQTDDLVGVTGTPRDVFVSSRTGLGEVFRLIRARPPCMSSPELACDNGVDDDCDGQLDCLDSDCSAATWCNAGGLCAATPITCGGAATDTQVGELQRISVYGCDLPAEPVAERMYSFAATQNGTVTATISGLQYPSTDLVVVGSTHGACEPSTCIGASTTLGADDTVTFSTIAGDTYFIIVDGQYAQEGTFTLSLSCSP